MATVPSIAKTLSQVLDQYRDQLSTIIKSEADKSPTSETLNTICAARTVDMAIANTAIAYQTDLNKLVVKVDKTIRDQLEIIRKWISYTRKRKGISFLQDIPLFIKNLPSMTKLYRMDPPHPVIKDNLFSVTFIGEFPDAVKVNCRPQLTFLRGTFYPDNATPTRLEFKIPLIAIKCPKVSQNYRSYVEMKLETYHFHNLWFSVQQTVEFPRLHLGLLPAIAGTLERTTIALDPPEKQPKVSQEYQVEAKDDTVAEKQFEVLPTPGYQFDLFYKPIVLQSASSQGDREIFFRVLNSERMVVQAEVKKGSFSRFCLRYIEKLHNSKEVKEIHREDMRWNCPYIFAREEVERGLKFTNFEGKTTQLTVREETTSDYQWKPVESEYQLIVHAPIHI